MKLIFDTEKIKGLKENPDGRRHIISLWQVDDFKDPHGLKPCCFQTNFNVRYKDDKTYLDMTMYQRSTDYMTAGCGQWYQQTPKKKLLIIRGFKN